MAREGSIKAIAARARANDPRPRVVAKVDRAMAAANDPKVTSGKASTAARERVTDPPVRGGHPGRNLGKFLHKGKR